MRIARRLWSFIQHGFKPRRDITSFIEWDFRELNAVADHAANCALDMSSPWELKDELATGFANRNEICYRICVDGALRGNGQASGGMAVLAYTCGGVQACLYRAGVLFGCLDSAFSAEVLAMEWALESFYKNFVANL